MTIAINTDIGFAAALTGITPAQVPNTTLTQMGFSFAAYDAQLEDVPQLLVGNRDMRSGGIKSPVPVYRFSNTGERKIESWPCISFELVGMRHDPKRRIHPNDRITIPVEGSKTTVVNGAGVSETGYAQVRRRKHPEPYVLRYDIGLWALENNEVFYMLSAVQDILPPFGGLPVLWADGTPYTLQLNLVNMLNADGEQPMLSSPETGHGWHWVLTYEVETWMDTTLATFLRRTVTSPTQFNLSRLPNPT